MPTELIKKTANYLDTSDIYHFSLTNHYINNFNFIAWLLPYYLLYTYDDKDYINNKGVILYFKDDFRDYYQNRPLNVYLKDIAISFTTNHTPFNKSKWCCFKRSDRFKHFYIRRYLKNQFTENLRLLTTQEEKYQFFTANSLTNKQQLCVRYNKMKYYLIHEIFRIPWTIYMHLRREFPQVLALIY